jgi:NTE family protein
LTPVTAALAADLVLEGGGVKGIGLVGAYSVLDSAGYRFRRIAGTSAGAIVGALIAAGAPPDRLAHIMRAIDYRRFEDKGFVDHFGVPGRGLSLLLEKGIYEGVYLRDWLHGLLSELGVTTFGDLRITDDPDSSLPPERAYRLVVLTSDVSRGRLVRLPWDYPRYGLDPDEQVVADAVRASTSIPILYEPVILEGSYLVDGGMLSNFPIDVFDRTDGKPPRWPTFGLKLSARPQNPVEERFEVQSTLGLLKAMIGTMMNFHDQMHIDDPAVLARTMFIDTLGVKGTDFDIDEATQTALYENGRTAATKFLKAWDFTRYRRTYRVRTQES